MRFARKTRGFNIPAKQSCELSGHAALLHEIDQLLRNNAERRRAHHRVVIAIENMLAARRAVTLP